MTLFKIGASPVGKLHRIGFSWATGWYIFFICIVNKGHEQKVHYFFFTFAPWHLSGFNNDIKTIWMIHSCNLIAPRMPSIKPKTVFSRQDTFAPTYCRLTAGKLQEQKLLPMLNGLASVLVDAWILQIHECSSLLGPFFASDVGIFMAKQAALKSFQVRSIKGALGCPFPSHASWHLESFNHHE